MSEKSALFMARTTRFHEFARSLTTTLGVEVSLATPDSPTAAHDFDLLILDSDGIRSDRIDQIAKWLDDRGGVPMLVIVDDEALGTLRLPNHAHADFVCPTATPNELKARAQRLMGEEETVTADDVLNIDNLEINLATYQVTLDGEPIDLTLMEYSLLSFLATHPNRAYSREGALRLNVVNDYSYTLETIIQAGWNRIPMTSVPVRTNPELRPSRLFKSMWRYMKRSSSVILRAFAMYKPLRFFGIIGGVFFGLGVLLGVRFLIIFFSTGSGSGHIQSLILCAALLMIGVQVIVAGVQADLISDNRKLLEDVQYRVRKMEIDRAGEENKQ